MELLYTPLGQRIAMRAGVCRWRPIVHHHRSHS
jgi:hypothetical protein